MTVALVADVVTTIVVQLAKPADPLRLAKDLRIDAVEAVEISNARGELLGQAYPERGVLFSFSPGQGSPRVSQVILEPIDWQPFLQCRGESAQSAAA